jgi:hypothetical protein
MQLAVLATYSTTTSAAPHCTFIVVDLDMCIFQPMHACMYGMGSLDRWIMVTMAIFWRERYTYYTIQSIHQSMHACNLSCPEYNGHVRFEYNEIACSHVVELGSL